MITDFIFNHVKDDRFNKKLDVLSICGMLVSFVVNSQSHLYFVMENIKKAMDIFNKKYDIEKYFLSNQRLFRIPNLQPIFKPFAMLFPMHHLI